MNEAIQNSGLLKSSSVWRKMTFLWKAIKVRGAETPNPPLHHLHHVFLSNYFLFM